MIYEFKCKNTECEDYNKVKEYSISIKDYKIPNCEKCNIEMVRVYSSFGAKTSDGFKTS